MHPDTHIPVTRRSGEPDFQERQELRLASIIPRPDSPPNIGPLRAVAYVIGGGIAVLLIAVFAVLVLGAAAIVGWDRAEARAISCGALPVSCVQEAGR